jgi:hypothetical protein
MMDTFKSANFSQIVRLKEDFENVRVIARITARMNTGSILRIIADTSSNLLLMLVSIIFVIPFRIGSRIRPT